MSKLVVPNPPPQYPPSKMPKACWWRHALLHASPEGYLYYITRDGGDSMDDCTYITWEWYDGIDKTIDYGFDRIDVIAMAITFINPIDYIDLLSDHRPAESFYRITEYGDHQHPGMHAVPDLEGMRFSDRSTTGN